MGNLSAYEHGLAHKQAGSYKQAIDFFEQAAADAAQAVRATSQIALCLFAIGRHEEAARSLALCWKEAKGRNWNCEIFATSWACPRIAWQASGGTGALSDSPSAGVRVPRCHVSPAPVVVRSVILFIPSLARSDSLDQGDCAKLLTVTAKFVLTVFQSSTLNNQS